METDTHRVDDRGFMRYRVVLIAGKHSLRMMENHHLESAVHNADLFKARTGKRYGVKHLFTGEWVYDTDKHIRS